MATTRGNRRTSKAASSYDELKEFQGKKYSGMKVGRRHKWHYQQGEWSEKKVTPDRWEFDYAVVKRRAGRAPEGSGAPVGTAYRWYILASQVVTKVDANSYTTAMVGIKHKLAHRRAGKDSWSASDAAQRRHLVKVLKELIADLEKGAPIQAEASSAPAAPPRRAPARPAARSRKSSHPPAGRRRRPRAA